MLTETHSEYRHLLDEQERKLATMTAGIEEALGGTALQTPAGRAIARMHIRALQEVSDAQARLTLALQASLRSALQREQTVDPAVAACIVDFEAELAVTEPPRQRAQAATAELTRALLALVDVTGPLMEAIDEFGSPMKVPRTDPRWVALLSAESRLREARAELRQAREVFRAVHRMPGLTPGH
ncbi:MAG: hypothetical protein J0M00_09250 [Burkholderiales bacterium]|nr:hypothetical protein [Burkholderiales bacterium]